MNNIKSQELAYYVCSHLKSATDCAFLVIFRIEEYSRRNKFHRQNNKNSTNGITEIRQNNRKCSLYTASKVSSKVSGKVSFMGSGTFSDKGSRKESSHVT